MTADSQAKAGYVSNTGTLGSKPFTSRARDGIQDFVMVFILFWETLFSVRIRRVKVRPTADSVAVALPEHGILDEP